MHLTPEEFVDIAESNRTADSMPHLATCAGCRDELAAIRAAMTSAADAEVPEPSPLYWNQLIARVNDAIDRDLASDRTWWKAWTRPRILVPLSAVAALAIVVLLVPASRDFRGAPPRAATAPANAPTTSAGPAEPRESVDPDPLLAMVADLSATMDFDSAADAGFTERGSAERAVTRMTADELRTLKQLLQAELLRPGV